MASEAKEEAGVTLSPENIRDICFREIWPQLNEGSAFTIQNEDEAKYCFLHNRPKATGAAFDGGALSEEKRQECWSAILSFVGNDFNWNNVRVTRDELEGASKHLRLKCDFVKRFRYKVPKSHLWSCNYGSLLRLLTGRRMLVVALYGKNHDLKTLNWKDKKSALTQKLLAVFRTFTTDFVMKSTKCATACKRMQTKLHNDIYAEEPYVEKFSLLAMEEVESESDDNESEDSESDAGSTNRETSRKRPRGKLSEIASSRFKLRMKLLLELDRDLAHEDKQSRVRKLYENTFYVKKSTVTGAGFGLFTAEAIAKGTPLLGEKSAPHVRMQRFGDLMKFNGNSEFKSTPKIVDATEEAQENYRKSVFEEESQDFVNAQWRELAADWNADVERQQGMSQSMKSDIFQDPTADHPYAIYSRVLRGYNKEKKMYLYTKYYNPFNKLWGFINGKSEGYNLKFVRGNGDNKDKAYFGPTQLAAVEDIPAHTELFFDYGEQYRFTRSANNGARESESSGSEGGASEVGSDGDNFGRRSADDKVDDWDLVGNPSTGDSLLPLGEINALPEDADFPFGDFDFNGDGVLNHNEVRGFVTDGLGLGNAKVFSIKDAMDVNGDGVVTEDEFHNYFNE